MLTRKSSRKVLCNICLQICQDIIGRIQCRHNYCFQCIHKWAVVKNKCPICKKKITKVLKQSIINSQQKKLKIIEPQQFDIESEASSSEYQSLPQEYVQQSSSLSIIQPVVYDLQPENDNTPTLQLRGTLNNPRHR